MGGHTLASADEGMVMRNHAKVLVVLNIAVAIGCSDAGQPEPADSTRAADALREVLPAGEPVSATVRAQLDSGNVAYAEGQYENALRHYREAVRETPESAASWFGIQMAATALGNRALADSARQRIESLSPGTLPQGHEAPLHPIRDTAR
jgi:tetratricopeptide (TPR) repeat protein